jgi:hypothetical protein
MILDFKPHLFSQTSEGCRIIIKTHKINTIQLSIVNMKEMCTNKHPSNPANTFVPVHTRVYWLLLSCQCSKTDGHKGHGSNQVYHKSSF